MERLEFPQDVIQRVMRPFGSRLCEEPAESLNMHKATGDEAISLVNLHGVYSQWRAARLCEEPAESLNMHTSTGDEAISLNKLSRRFIYNDVQHVFAKSRQTV